MKSPGNKSQWSCTKEKLCKQSRCTGHTIFKSVWTGFSQVCLQLLYQFVLDLLKFPYED